MLRDRGSGPTFLISPLLSLMRNQQQMATRLGVRAMRIDGANRKEWPSIMAALRDGTCDLLMVSPERLANDEFRTDVLPVIQRGIGMMVVDEAHCISDWGHDFRPDYRRIVQIVKAMPSNVPVLATTATANNRVVQDIHEQLGDELGISRGPLARTTLRLQTLRLGTRAERLAWLGTHLPDLPGTGIIYCLTVRDTELVANWLRPRGIDVEAYHAQRAPEERVELEERLLANDLKALAATVALGMGFDKQDLGFVVHYLRPGSVVSYYQQVGRAGQDAYAILLSGDESDDIQQYFIDTAFPGADALIQVEQAIANSDGLPPSHLQRFVNLPQRRLEQCLKLLEVEGAIARQDGLLVRTPLSWRPDVDRYAQISRIRYRELAVMQEFMSTDRCLMEFIARELDDPQAAPCGRCANCVGPLFDESLDSALVAKAAEFLRRDWIPILPRTDLPRGTYEPGNSNIDGALLLERGFALCAYADDEQGDIVRNGKYRDGRFDDRLVEAAAKCIRDSIIEKQHLNRAALWIASVPSLRHTELVPNFAARLGARLGIPYVPVLQKVRETEKQRSMQNSAQQYRNIKGAFRPVAELVRPGPVILVDDMVDSRWTMTACGARRRAAGSGLVYPFALAAMQGRG
jgi:ATP-dependent DNA helicase RecQ